jgi:hypothetical protein
MDKIEVLGEQIIDAVRDDARSGPSTIPGRGAGSVRHGYELCPD